MVYLSKYYLEGNIVYFKEYNLDWDFSIMY